MEVTLRDVPISVEWIGTMAGSVTASIRSQVEGSLKEMSYKEGSKVKKGDVLFQLDRSSYESTLQDAEAKLAQAMANLGKSQKDVERLTPLAQAKAVSQSDLDNARQANLANEALVASAQAVVDKAKLNLSFTTIIAPLDGVAGLAKVQVGDLITPNSSELAVVSTVDPIKVYFTVSEQQYLKYRQDNPQTPEGRDAGGKAEFEIILADGSLFPKKGKFHAADISVNANTGSLRLCAIFENPGNLLLPGQYARVRSVSRVAKDAVVVPERAVNELQGIQQVAVITPEGKASIRTIKAGPRVTGGWLIEEGLKAGDKVIVEGFMKVREGTPVTPVPFEMKPAAPAAPAPVKDAK
jgi:membrane fusion protein (multidrug efflux system)